MCEMKPIIDPVAREEIERELTAEKKIRNTNKAGNEIYVITAANSPAVMREIARRDSNQAVKYSKKRIRYYGNQEENGRKRHFS